MKTYLRTKCFLLLFVALGYSQAANSQTNFTSEQKFQDLFVTAGYSTAFGAALGTAVLGLVPNPAANLHYIAMGASLGFIAGSLFGVYVVFTPDFLAGDSPNKRQTAMFAATSTPVKHPRLQIAPRIDSRSLRLQNIVASLSFATS